MIYSARSAWPPTASRGVLDIPRHQQRRTHLRLLKESTVSIWTGFIFYRRLFCHRPGRRHPHVRAPGVPTWATGSYEQECTHLIPGNSYLASS